MRPLLGDWMAGAAAETLALPAQDEAARQRSPPSLATQGCGCAIRCGSALPRLGRKRAASAGWPKSTSANHPRVRSKLTIGCEGLGVRGEGAPSAARAIQHPLILAVNNFCPET